MSHVDITRWSDYVRGLAHPSETESLHRHLATCGRCSGTVATLQRVQATGRADRRSRPPDPAVRIAKALIALRRSRTLSENRQVALELANDSWAPGALSASLRSSDSDVRRMSFSGEDLALDLEFAFRRDPDALDLGGELAHDRRGPMRKVPVFLLAGQRVLADATTDAAGHFALSAEFDEPLRLSLILLEDDRFIDVDLESPGPD